MNLSILGGHADGKPTPAIALRNAVLTGAPNSTAFSTVQHLPSIYAAALPTAAIICQVQHNRETALIDEYGQLRENWDGYDADPISEDACAAAKEFLQSLPSNFASPDLCPNPGGTISMEWASGNGTAQVEFGRSKFSFYLRRKGAPTLYHRGEAKSASTVYAFLAVLYANPRPRSITQIGY
ncbi:hypothetical protein [Paraburkholderia sp. J7]|uniref:hypothetical protein n=1 Tax=Paraburkholderia sp. J7 TaxID=2805438 RepID=UPI002AB689E6|nr:hypothetical protein [Paraburkholderia sp. J7]